MKRIIWLYGLIAGAFIGGFMLIGMATASEDSMGVSEIVGYASMLVGMSLVVVGIKQVREKHLGGNISFGAAFKVGILIVVIANVIYSGAWTIYSEVGGTDFYQKYHEMQVEKYQEQITDPDELAAKIEEGKQMIEMMENPLMRFFFTFVSELLPVGLLVTLIASLVLKRKSAAVE